MGLLPLGTANAYAREIGIPLGLEAAAQCATGNCVKWFDVGRTGQRAFVNMLSLGLSSRIAGALRKQDKRRLGRFAYVYAIHRGWTDHRPFELDLTAPDLEWHGRAVQVVLAVGRTHAGPFPVAPDASLESGELAGYLVPATGHAALMKLAWQLACGGIPLPATVPRFRGGSFRIATSPSIKVNTDGESVSYTPIQVECLPRALPVACPD